MYKLNDNMSKFMINFLVDWELMNAEEELKRIKERQEQGIKVAKDQNKHFSLVICSGSSSPSRTTFPLIFVYS